MFRVPNFEVVEFTDPLCTWCWGSEPILKKLESRFSRNLKISYVMGGLIEDIRNYRDYTNDMCGNIEEANKSIANHWVEASKHHKMPVCIEGFRLFTEKYNSSYPTNIAYHAAKLQSEEKANKFLRRMREAVATEAAQITNTKVLIELASDVGLRVGAFIQAIEDGTAARRFEEDLHFTRTNRVHTFPSYLIRNNFNGKSIVLKGYQDYSSFIEVINQISDDELKINKIDKSPESIITFLKKEIKITPVELQTIFDLTDEELEEDLKIMLEKGYITIEEVGTGSFIYYLGRELICDPETGVCYY